MKHLKIRGELSKDHTHVMVHIVEQTHRCAEFGNVSILGGFGSFQCNEPVTLFSARFPSFIRVSYSFGVEGHSRVYVRGAAGQLDHTPIKIPIDLWPKLKAAVNAYNEWGAAQED